ncbi:MAG: SDR family NAD(P)-dependent oxidoreductase [Ideonella sp.]
MSQRPVVVVTGGSSNIGLACVRRFSADHRVLIADLQAPQDSVADNVDFIRTDITDAQACAAMMSRANELGPVVALIHSAAITAPARPVQQISADEWRRVIDVNLTGAFLVAQSATAALLASHGSMVMISSRAARTGVAALVPNGLGTKPHYCASKAGVLALVKSLAVELASGGVRVNAVVPGSIEGQMIPRERWPELAARIPLGRLGLPEEIADSVRFLCSPQARYITGQSIDVNGGTWMN